MMRSLPIALLTAALIFAPPAHAKKRSEVHPYLELDQTVFGSLKPSGPALTYTTVAAGIDASTSGPRAEAQVSARYEYRHAWNKQSSDSHVVSGLARARVDVAPNLLSLEGGALGTRVRTDQRGDAPNLGLDTPSNTSQLYSAYVGPTLATQVGGLNVGAFYRFGYSKVDTQTPAFLPVGSPSIGSFDSATNHSAGASVGMKSGVLPFGWTVSAGYTHEDASQLDQRFEGKYGRADVVVPLGPTVAATGGVGYEKIESSQRDAKRDAAGNAIVDDNGRFVTDPASPRRLSYDTSGLIWDVGVLWKPSRRTSLAAKVGRRYGSMTYGLDASYSPNARNAFSVVAYDGVTTFGQEIGAAVARIPTNFVVSRDPFSNQFGGCVQGGAGAGAGACLSPALQSLASGTYRSRGVGGQWSFAHNRLSGGVGIGYAQRRFYAPPVGGFAIAGTTDRTVYVDASVGYKLDEASALTGSFYANWYDSGILAAPRVLGVGGTASYVRNFGPQFSTQASLGLYSSDVDGLGSSLTAAGQLGARYTF